LLREWRLDATKSVNLGLSAQSDHAHSTRPGGDRLGYQVQGGAVVLVGPWRLRPEVSYASWDSRELFAPGLIDVKRHNRLRQAALLAEKPLGPNTTLALEWRGRWAYDTVVLYKYQEQMLSATLALRF
jgi:hypothetical protein